MMRFCTSDKLTLTYPEQFRKYVAPKASYCMNPQMRLRSPLKMKVPPKQKTEEELKALEEQRALQADTTSNHF